MAQGHQSRLLAHLEHLDKQSRQGAQVAAAEVADLAVFLLLVAGQHPECRFLPAGLLDLAGPGQSNAVGVQERHHHHPRVVGLLSAEIFMPEVSMDLTQIQLSGHIEQEEHQEVHR